MLKKIMFMMLLIYPVLAYALDSLSNSSNGCPTNPISVPFSNFTLNKNCSVFAAYSFGSINKMLFCYADAANTAGVLYWPYLGKSYSGKMPIVLTISSIYEGFLADNSGTLHIINNTNASISVYCIYAF